MSWKYCGACPYWDTSSARIPESSQGDGLCRLQPPRAEVDPSTGRPVVLFVVTSITDGCGVPSILEMLGSLKDGLTELGEDWMPPKPTHRDGAGGGYQGRNRGRRLDPSKGSSSKGPDWCTSCGAWIPDGHLPDCPVVKAGDHA